MSRSYFLRNENSSLLLVNILDTINPVFEAGSYNRALEQAYASEFSFDVNGLGYRE